MNPIFYIDFYKVGHISQYPKGITRVWSNWTPRGSRTAEKEVVHFGLQYFCKEYLMDAFQRDFFGRPLIHVVTEYRDLIRTTLGDQNPRVDHIEELHRLGYLPIEIYSIPEGRSSALRVPSMVIVNTLPNFFWLPNYLETIMSACLWLPSTSATTAKAYRRLFLKYAREFGEPDCGFVDWQGHDFSFRGMAALEASILSGMGHLTSFSGTDTIPAIIAARRFYGAELGVGGSVPATEHSVMCAGSKESEFETFRRLLTEVYPTGIVSIVSDTWNLWRVLTVYLPKLRETILKRDGKIVIRPDSGDPVKILCGDPDATDGAARAGTLRLMAQVLGTDGRGHINKGGAIYGDAITLERADQILERLTHEHHLSPFNCVFGIGSFTYQYVTRDTYGFAMKATAIEQNGEVVPIFKDPVTDSGEKKSLRGVPIVRNGQVSETSDPLQLDACDFRKVFQDGRLLVDESFCSIRDRVRSGL